MPAHTSGHVNRRIRARTETAALRAVQGGPAQIDARLRELDREWDIERTLEANAAAASLVGLALGGLLHPAFRVFSAIVAAFLLQHALQGWCPPLPVFRRLGVRTAREIDEERYALKALRGDFDHARRRAGTPPGAEDVSSALDAAAS